MEGPSSLTAGNGFLSNDLTEMVKISGNFTIRLKVGHDAGSHIMLLEVAGSKVQVGFSSSKARGLPGNDKPNRTP